MHVVYRLTGRRSRSGTGNVHVLCLDYRHHHQWFSFLFCLKWVSPCAPFFFLWSASTIVELDGTMWRMFNPTQEQNSNAGWWKLHRNWKRPAISVVRVLSSSLRKRTHNWYNITLMLKKEKKKYIIVYKFILQHNWNQMGKGDVWNVFFFVVLEWLFHPIFFYR